MPTPRTLPTVKVDPTPGRRNRFYVYAYPSGSRRKFTFATHDAATVFLADVLRLGADRAASRYGLRRAADRLEFVSLAEYALEYATSREHASTQQAYLGQARYLTEFAPTSTGDVRTLDVADLEAYVEFLRNRPNGRGGVLAPNTVRMAWILARNVLDRLVRQGIIASNPARSVEDVPKAPRKGSEDLAGYAIPASEFRAIADRMPDEARPLVEVLWASGVRIGEALALRWKNVRPDTRPGRQHLVELFVEHSLTLASETELSGGTKRYVLGPTKGKRSRSVGMKASALDGLERGAPDEFVFPLSRDFYTHAWRRARAEAAAAGEAPATVRLHDLRHSRVTRLLGAPGMVLHEVSETIGHASTAFTMDRYAHAIPSRVRDLGDVD